MIPLSLRGGVGGSVFPCRSCSVVGRKSSPGLPLGFPVSTAAGIPLIETGLIKAFSPVAGRGLHSPLPRFSPLPSCNPIALAYWPLLQFRCIVHCTLVHYPGGRMK